jgi:hypothetical protein
MIATPILSGASGTKTLAVFTPRHSSPPATLFATLDTRNSVAVLDFDDATIESAIFPSIVPEAADLASGLSVNITWTATTAPTGTAESSTGWTITRITTDADGSVTATQSATGAWSSKESLSYS